MASESIESAPWVKDAPIKILIHGYTGHKDFSPNTEIRPGDFMTLFIIIIIIILASVSKQILIIQSCTLKDIAHVVVERLPIYVVVLKLTVLSSVVAGLSLHPKYLQIAKDLLVIATVNGLAIIKLDILRIGDRKILLGKCLPFCSEDKSDAHSSYLT